MGRAPSIEDEALLKHLTEVFRRSGYEGASLTALSSASGLHRASLYHRFPNGKPAMAAAVMASVEQIFSDILDPLMSEDDPSTAVAEMARRVGAFYDDGRLACVLDTMTLRGAPDDIRARATHLATTWLTAMAEIARRAGASEEDAARRARTALVLIEGSLVVARVLDDPAEFRLALAELPQTLIAAPANAGEPAASSRSAQVRGEDLSRATTDDAPGAIRPAGAG